MVARQLRRPGLSLVEVVLALLIVAVLIGLVLAAILRVRDAAARTLCANNLKLIAQSIHSYNDAHDHFPPLTDQGSGSPTGNGIQSVLFNILPYVEADYLYYVGTTFGPNAYYAPSSSLVYSGTLKGSPVQQWGGSANKTIPAFLDPADSPADGLRDVAMTLPDGSTGYYATGSYAVNGLVPWGTGGGLPKLFPRGTAETVLIGERPQVCRTAAGETVYNLWGLGFYSPHMPAFAALTPTDPPSLASTGQIAPVEPLPGPGEEITVRIGRQDAPPQPPDFRTPLRSLRGAGPCDPRLPGSAHYQGLQTAMADGSVRMWAWDTSPRVFWAACVPGVP
jgi:type II secretory pathway pseudopilin PulG